MMQELYVKLNTGFWSKSEIPQETSFHQQLALYLRKKPLKCYIEHSFIQGVSGVMVNILGGGRMEYSE